jgi:hypothetical protein
MLVGFCNNKSDRSDQFFGHRDMQKLNEKKENEGGEKL